MKKKPQQPKQTVQIVAHYLIPTYNLYGNVARSHIIKSCYGDQEADVNVWLVKALLGDEEHSFAASFGQQRLLYDMQYHIAKNNLQREHFKQGMIYINNIINMSKDADFECVAGDGLKAVVVKYLDDMHAIYNLAQAKLVAGVLR